jgi:hypothetical protein
MMISFSWIKTKNSFPKEVAQVFLEYLDEEVQLDLYVLLSSVGNEELFFTQYVHLRGLNFRGISCPEKVLLIGIYNENCQLLKKLVHYLTVTPELFPELVLNNYGKNLNQQCNWVMASICESPSPETGQLVLKYWQVRLSPHLRMLLDTYVFNFLLGRIIEHLPMAVFVYKSEDG